MSKKKQQESNRAIQEQLQRVIADLKVEDPNYAKFKCPICKGMGLAVGKWSSPSMDPKQVGRCYFCGGTGVARRKKKFNEQQ